VKKMFSYLNKKAQSTLEYAVIIAIVVAGLIAMQVYIKRGIHGRLRDATDQIGEQFSPTLTTGTTTTTSIVRSSEKIDGGAQPTTTSTSKQEQTRTVNEKTATLNQEVW
jgi:Flp pilus assembly pilin Flp